MLESTRLLKDKDSFQLFFEGAAWEIILSTVQENVPIRRVIPSIKEISLLIRYVPFVECLSVSIHISLSWLNSRLACVPLIVFISSLIMISLEGFRPIVEERGANLDLRDIKTFGEFL